MKDNKFNINNTQIYENVKCVVATIMTLVFGIKIIYKISVFISISSLPFLLPGAIIISLVSSVGITFGIVSIIERIINKIGNKILKKKRNQEESYNNKKYKINNQTKHTTKYNDKKMTLKTLYREREILMSEIQERKNEKSKNYVYTKKR